MSIQDERSAASREPRPEAGETRLPILGLIAGLEGQCQPGVPPGDFVRELVRGFVALANAVYGAFWQTSPQTRAVGVAAELMPQVTERGAQGWRAALAELARGVLDQEIIRYVGVSEPADRLLTGERYVAVGFAVRGQPAVAGCVTIVVKGDNPILSDAGVGLLQFLANYGLLHTSLNAAAHSERSYQSLSRAWEIVGETLAFKAPRAMAQVLANRARTALHADRVSVGFVRRERVTVVAISGEDTIDKRSNVARLIQAAQTEVVISGEPASYRQDLQGDAQAAQLSRYPQQEQLARAGGAAAVYSVPLKDEQAIIGVCTFEFTGATPTEETRQTIDVTTGQLGPVLNLGLKNARGFVGRTGDGLAASAKWCFGHEHPWRKLGLVAALGLLALAIFGRVAFSISASCRLEPSFRRIYAAPFNTTIKRAPVRPGDTVDSGDVLVELNREDVQSQLREARAKRTSAVKERDTYEAQEKPALAAEAEARVEALAAEIELLERRLRRTTILSEDRGIVITGDLRQDIDRPVNTGDALIEVAPLDPLLLELEISQGDVDYVQVGQTGRFTTKARPNLSLPFTVIKVRPTPEVREGSSAYVAEAEVPNPDGWLRPGMEGAAKIAVGRRNITWVYTRRIVDWLRLHLWW